MTDGRHAADRTYPCAWCDAQFANHSDRAAHEQQHTDDEIERDANS